MQQLEAEFVRQTKRPINSTEKQRQYILSQIRFYYPDEPELNVINRLLSQPPRSTSVVITSEKARHFLSLCHDLHFVGFSLLEIATQHIKGQLKKVPRGCPAWKQITRENYEQYVVDHHTAFAFITGQMSNMTVIDCDSRKSHQQLITDFPELANTLTVQTRQGFHMYCQYCPKVKTSHGQFECYPQVDIRNDDGIIFAPPTEYMFGQELVSYTFARGGDALVPFPEKLADQAKNSQVLAASIEDTQMTSIDQLTRAHVKQLFNILRPLSCVVPHRPVICNGIFEIGYQPATTSFEAMYYIKFFSMLCINVNNITQSELASILKVYLSELTFAIYETTRGYHLYCVSCQFAFRDTLARYIEHAFKVSSECIQFTMHNGWHTRLTHRTNDTFVERYVGRLGSQPVDSDLETLLEFKDAVASVCSRVDEFTVDDLKARLSSLTVPRLELFISFHSNPHPEMNIATPNVD